MPFSFQPTTLPGVIAVKSRIFEDERGFFLESYRRDDFVAAGITASFVQDNLSFSTRGVLRGIHFQYAPHAQGKLVRTIDGKVWDLAVDLRPDSSTFRKWIGVELDSAEGDMLYIPAGYGHAFVVLSESAHFFYKCSAAYTPQGDGGVRWDDPDLAIEWPIENPVVSGKDACLPSLAELLQTGRL